MSGVSVSASERGQAQQAAYIRVLVARLVEDVEGRSLHLGAVRRHLRHLHLLANLSADDQDQDHHFTVDGQDQHHLSVTKRGRGQDRHDGTG